MNQFSPDSKCVKCGCDQAKAVYHETMRYWVKHGDKPPFKDIRFITHPKYPQAEQECIRRTCTFCGYQWDEEPLDHENKTT